MYLFTVVVINDVMEIQGIRMFVYIVTLILAIAFMKIPVISFSRFITSKDFYGSRNLDIYNFYQCWQSENSCRVKSMLTRFRGSL